MPLIDLNGLGYSKSKENAMIASKPEAGALATNTHAVDEYFYWKGTLHQATASIAVGDTIALGTNVKIGVLADGITEAKNGTYGLYDQDTVDGASIVTFDDGADGIPLKNLTVNIEPVQDLHGYGNPWPAGATPNIFDEQVEIGGISTSNGGNIVQTDRLRSVNYIPVIAGQSYYFYRSTPKQHSFFYYDSSKVFISNVDMGTANGAFAVPEGAAFVRFIVRDTDLSAKIAINYPSTEHDYLPYSNICPITGWTEANVTRTGKNLYNPDNLDSFDVTGQGAIRYGRIFKSGTYTVINNNSADDFFGKIVKTDLSSYGDGITFTRGGTSRTVDVPVGYMLYVYFGARTLEKHSLICVSIGNNTVYEAYNGTTYPITFPEAAGTVYGGTLDVTNGVLTVDREMWSGTIADGTAQVTSNNYIRYQFYPTITHSPNQAGISTGKISNLGMYYYADSYTYPHWYNNAYGTVQLFVPESVESSTPVQFVMSLATPITYTLTPIEVKTLLGVNNVWADCGDIEELTYRKKAVSSEDMQALIESKNTLTQALIAPVLNEMKADTALVLNDFRIVDNQLYRITTNVAAGAKLTPYTNCNTVTITEILKYLLSD